MEAFAKKFSTCWYTPAQNKNRRSGYQEIKRSRKQRYDAEVRIHEKEIALVNDERHYWAKELRFVSLRLKHQTGLDTAEQGRHNLTAYGVGWQSRVPEWQKDNLITRIKQFKVGRLSSIFSGTDVQAWHYLGHLWATIDLFRLAWNKFHEGEQPTQGPSPAAAPVPATNHKGRQAKAAVLRNISIDEVREIFKSLNIGSIYNQPGEWAAAFRALTVGDYLVGSPPEIDRWAIASQFSGRSLNSIVETLKRNKDFFQPEEFSKTQIIVFKGVKKELEKYEKDKRNR
ncbi:hypothetical protein [Hymenobacter jejuensis]|uniref:Uncharacterized protein n=1 Tax=Hymenobacter jejuensis TaxID=2502781 RepID=A0A5B8A032_9BACT|nr:hypothetical protein [Hymenobacter jejuensis]QDA60005.1 hypothetical protein FHG12_07725 [Hymenobacter jejuensis]